MATIEDIAWKVQKSTRAWLKENTPGNERTEKFFEADKSFIKSGRVVPVNEVIACLHWMAARWLFAGYPKALRLQIEEWIVQKSGALLAKKLGRAALSEAVATSRSFAVLIESAMASNRGDEVARDFEAAIRESCVGARREFNEFVLNGNGVRGKVRDVHSRHPAGVKRTRGKGRKTRAAHGY